MCSVCECYRGGIIVMDVIWRGVCGNVCCVAAVVKDSVFSLGVLKYVV